MELRTITQMYETSQLPQRQQASGDDVHVAQPGDTVETIAHQYGAPAGLIRQINPQIRDGDRIPVGDTVNLPGGGNPANGLPIGSTELPHMGMPASGNGLPGNPGTGGGLPLLDVIVRTVFPSNGNSPLQVSLPLGGDTAPRADEGGIALGLPKSDVAIPDSLPDRGASDTQGASTLPDARGSSAPPDAGTAHTAGNDAPPASSNASDTPKTATASNASIATNPTQLAATTVAPGVANAVALIATGVTSPALAGTLIPTLVTLSSTTASSLAQAVPTTAAGALQPAIAAVAIAPEEPPPATQSDRRDLPRLLESGTAVVQGRGETEKPANDADPARLLRDVQARILSDPRAPTEATRASAFADQNLKSQEKPTLIPKATGDAAADEVLKNSGLLLSERSARASVRQSGDPSAMFDWVGQLAQLKRAYARTRADDSTDLPTTAAVIGTVVVLIAGLFALYALYRYWAPH